MLTILSGSPSVLEDIYCVVASSLWKWWIHTVELLVIFRGWSGIFVSIHRVMFQILEMKKGLREFVYPFYNCSWIYTETRNVYIP